MILFQCQHCHAKTDPDDAGEWLELRRVGDAFEDSMHLCPQCQRSKQAILDVMLESDAVLMPCPALAQA